MISSIRRIIVSLTHLALAIGDRGCFHYWPKFDDLDIGCGDLSDGVSPHTKSTSDGK